MNPYHCVLIVPRGRNNPVSLAGMASIMHFATENGLPFTFELWGAHGTDPVRMSEFLAIPAGDMSSELKPDFIFIPPAIGPIEQALAQNKDMIEWLGNMYEQGAKLASFCMGAYFLAETGLLDGKEASSHCDAIADLRLRYPNVKWVPEKIIADQQGLYSSGGTFSSFNLLIYLLEKYGDPLVARHIARFLQLDYPRQSQVPFYRLINQQSHQDAQIQAVQQYMQEHLDQVFSLDEVATEHGLSRRSLNRRFKAATGESPQTYRQKLRVEQARRWLENGRYSVKEVVYQLGYQDEPSFRKLFKRHTGMTPMDYKRKFA